MDPEQTTGFLPKTESPVGLASPMARLAAFILDLLLLFPLIRIMQAPTQRGLMTASLLEDQPGVLSYKLLSVFVFVGVFLAYHTLFIYWRGQTLGKMFFGVQVVSLVGPLTLWSALSRAVFLLFGLGMAYLPFLAIFYHPLRRSLHDRIADTLVIGLKEVVSWPQLSERRGSFALMTSTIGGALIV
jgi:uncharacterized RDD family membrane protein YckC